MVAIHNRALTQGQITQNFDAGVGERFYLLFSVSHLVDVPQSYLLFEASQFDSYSYLFNKPAFISLDGTVDPDQIRIQGVRIGLNGAEAKVGQAYAPLNRTVTAAGYVPETGFGLSGLGTVVALDKGPSADEFFLSFERIAATAIRTWSRRRRRCRRRRTATRPRRSACAPSRRFRPPCPR